MKRIALFFTVALLFAFTALEAQYYPYHYRNGYRRDPRERRAKEYFKPIVHISAGYGFPNLDRYELLGFQGYYLGHIQQSGPVYGSIDYQFSSTASIGILASYGKVNGPYYRYNDPPTGVPAFEGRLKDWTVMLNFVRYMNAGRVLTPYLRTAIGVSIWDQQYVDASGNKVFYGSEPPVLAYQAGLGLRINFAEHAGAFVEAGYGKYILGGGLSLRF